MNLDQLTEAVLQRLHDGQPRVFLIGEQPNSLQKYNYVNNKPYEAVMIGIVPPGDLLQMPSNTVCQALLDGIPVWYWPQQPFKSCTGAKALCRALLAAEQRLKQMGVQVLGEKGKLITASEARRLKSLGLTVTDRHMTPLAKDILEGKEP